MVRLFVLPVVLMLAACGTGNRIVSTESMSSSYGCAQMARLLHDPATPLTEVLRRSNCPTGPEWMVVRSRSAFENYENIGRNVRQGQRA